MPSRENVREEHIRMLRLRLRVDLTADGLHDAKMSRKQAEALIEQTKEEVLALFPGKGEVFDLVLRPRFLRILNERALAGWEQGNALNEGRGGVPPTTCV